MKLLICLPKRALWATVVFFGLSIDMFFQNLGDFVMNKQMFSPIVGTLSIFRETSKL